MSIHLRCARCTLPYAAPTDDAGTTVISADTLTVLFKSEGRAIAPICQSCCVAMMQLAEPQA